MMVGSCLYSVVVGLLRHLLIATTQLSELEGASTDAQSPSATLLLLLLLIAFQIVNFNSVLHSLNVTNFQEI